MVRQEGGINGIDVVSFFYSIAVRQFIKSNNYSKLRAINNCPIIKEDIKTQARHILRKILLYQINNTSIDCPESAVWITRTKVDLLVKTYSKSHQLIHNLGILAVSSVDPDLYRRGDYNNIRRSLPSKVLLVIDSLCTVENIEPMITILWEGKELNLQKVSSRLLNDLIKLTLNKTISYHPADKYQIDKYSEHLAESMANLKPYT